MARAQEASKRIAFVGAHGTGKTVLVNSFADRLSELGLAHQIVVEAPRVVCALAGDPAFFQRDRNSLMKQMLLLIGQPVLESLAQRESSSFVLCDRSLLDHWAYTRVLFRAEPSLEEVADLMEYFIGQYCASYDLIVHVPIEFALEVDAVREPDLEFQAEIDREIRRLLRHLNLGSVTVTGPASLRVAQTMHALRLG